MFSKNDRTSEGTATTGQVSQGSNKASVILPDLEVIGDLKSAGDIQVDGRVTGDIRSRSVVVSSGANVEGSIYAQTVQISGRVKGQIEAPKVAIFRSAEVIGDVLHETLEIESGAQFQGACRRLEVSTSALGEVKSTPKPAA